MHVRTRSLPGLSLQARLNATLNKATGILGSGVGVMPTEGRAGCGGCTEDVYAHVPATPTTLTLDHMDRQGAGAVVDIIFILR